MKSQVILIIKQTRSRFLNESLVVDILFLINTSVDLIFFYDMFVQMRTPYKDNNTGKYVRDVKLITASYLKSWFFIDLFSVFPFEFLGAGSTTSDLSQLRILKLMRLTRLFKLLRMFRANRKLKKLQVHSGLRYETVNNILVSLHNFTTLYGQQLIAMMIFDEGYRKLSSSSSWFIGLHVDIEW